MIVEAKWTGGMAFDLDLQGFTTHVDAEERFGGKGEGPQPKHLMLRALGGCTGMDVVSILGKMKVEFDSFSIDIDAELAENHPKVYTAVTLDYRFSGDSPDPAKIQKAVKLSLNSYCAVAATLSHTAEISYRIHLNGKQVAEGVREDD